MFQRLTSLFFSDSSAPEDLEEPKPFISKEEEEDDWLIIDITECSDPVSMESNPMEDLLIEHPSMSVYVTSSTIVVETQTPEEHINRDGEEPERRLQRHAPHHSTSLATKAAILEKVSQVHRIQRAKQLAEKHNFSQKVMQRQNRTRECRPRRAKHQGSFVYQPSQRQYNY
ncbi:tumor protein p53-inducible nuclear protein 2 isoform X2 [Anolis carolinensis]|uniref:Tumor protein p53 inducible nuclear protein 2 n=1 Tax=Anolis carolinensis TaxID=28377 RepID=A0A803SME6_ANOCA|nr:PREDICTED: tumor protein p53-inducible nuclear protein 2 [Anolis carolinensis]|eukprot:XP_003220542.1 PREDICTED: tumor protein p53-inducible nuclear protein 2 [Anolis carolinensis]